MDYPFAAVPFAAVRLTSGFWKARQDVNRGVTLPFALNQCEQAGRLENFDRAAEVLRRRAAGEATFQLEPVTIYPFDDTDVYKVLEAACYVLGTHPDATLTSRLDAWIARISAAQEPDGYLFTFHTMHPDSPAHEWCGAERWIADPELSHELYNSGHLYEAGVAHFEATGKRTLLDVCLKNAELLWREFGDGRRRLAPGHQIIEMGLVKLHRVTKDTRWLTLARIFLDARGPGGPLYNQRHERVVDQTYAVGNAVRANYQYAGMADVAVLVGDGDRYLSATKRLWDDVVQTKLYVTHRPSRHATSSGVGRRRALLRLEQSRTRLDERVVPHGSRRALSQRRSSRISTREKPLITEPPTTRALRSGFGGQRFVTNAITRAGTAVRARFRRVIALELEAVDDVTGRVFHQERIQRGLESHRRLVVEIPG